MNLEKHTSYIIHKPSKACFALCCASQNLFFSIFPVRPAKKSVKNYIGFPKGQF